MLEAIRNLFRGRLAPGDAPSADYDERTLRVAAAALLFEVVRADGEVKPEEQTVMQAAVQGTFSLTAPETRELIELAERESRSAASLYEFTRVIDAQFSAGQKKRVVELLWLVTFADTEKSPLEEHLVRKIAGLLHVPHPDFIDARIRAREQSR